MDFEVTDALIMEHASPESYSRGEEYFAQGAVGSLTRRGEQIEAQVAGSQPFPYRVTIAFNQEQIEAHCSCPYDWGGWCKHIVAALLAYVSSPKTVRELPSLDALLSPLDRGQLQALVLRLARLRPELADLIEAEVSAESISVAADSPELPAIGPAVYRARARAALQRVEHAWNHAYPGGAGLHEIDALLEEASVLVVRGEGRQALAMLEAVTAAMAENWERAWYEGDESSIDFDWLAAIWIEALLEADLTPDEREEWAERLDVWQAELENFGVEAFDDAVQAAWQGWDHPAVTAALQGKTSKELVQILSPALVHARLNVLERAGRFEEFLNLSGVAGAVEPHSRMLIKLRRTSDATAFALDRVETATEAETVAKALWDAGALDEALGVAEAGLKSRGAYDYHRGPLAAWVRDRARELDQPERAGKAAVIALQNAPNLANYEQVRELAGAEWPELRGALLDSLRAVVGYPMPGVVDIFLHENLIDDAIAHVDQSYSTDEIRKVAVAAATTRPDWVIGITTGHAESIMNRGKAKDYDRAIEWLAIARQAYASAARQTEWRDYLSGLIQLHQRKYKLRPMLERLGG